MTITEGVVLLKKLRRGNYINSELFLCQGSILYAHDEKVQLPNLNCRHWIYSLTKTLFIYD
jgi:hypothetical protein